MRGGLFLSLEGGEGSGKSTLLGRLRDFLEHEGYDVLITREPGGPPIAEAVRGILLDPGNTAMDALTELFLYLASRRQNLVERILPQLAKGGVVISDRFADASVAYQGGGRGLGLARVDRLNREAIGEHVPQLTFFLDVDPAQGLERGPGVTAVDRSGGDRIERETLEFHERVRRSYREWAALHPERIKVIDASLPPEAVAAAALNALSRLLAATD
ncbi:MAG: dTMP kinase [Candidatus Krumholzibacteriia bacterium]|nr:dTMP kinase [bacterium]MCB9514045.1 dTMP kinase [Candidatus Latescibacterota bacterium]MCB9515729.1 dTMP kinase [Candidatus Latescibacterota bacterium]